jgi:integrase
MLHPEGSRSGGKPSKNRRRASVVTSVRRPNFLASSRPSLIAAPLSRSSINQALSAVIVRHRDAGHAFDRKHQAIARTWKGICNRKANTETKRQARPLLADDMQALIGMLRPEVPAEARDAALLALGWAAALRRSELVGLDWQKRGKGQRFPAVKRARASGDADGLEGLPGPGRDNRGALRRHAGRLPGRGALGGTRRRAPR